jgi:hypothetical protein
MGTAASVIGAVSLGDAHPVPEVTAFIHVTCTFFSA